MFKTFIILNYFHIQTSAIKRKYPTMIVRIFLVSACTHSISRYIHIQTLCAHKRIVLRFLQHGTCHVVVKGGSHFCQSPKGEGSGVFFIKRKGGPTLFWEKIPKLPSPPPPKKNVPSLRQKRNLFNCLNFIVRSSEYAQTSSNGNSYKPLAPRVPRVLLRLGGGASFYELENRMGRESFFFSPAHFARRLVSSGSAAESPENTTKCA